jgi:hypothetical protein
LGLSLGDERRPEPFFFASERARTGDFAAVTKILKTSEIELSDVEATVRFFRQAAADGASGAT